MIRLSVILPCWNARATLPRALDALEVQTAPTRAFEVVVVDDGSTDGTSEMLATRPSSVARQVVRQPNRGLAAARNAGAVAARGEILLFLDPDVVAQPGLVEAHLQHYAAGPDLLAVQGRTVADPKTLDTAFMQTSNLQPDFTIRRPTNLSPFHVIGRNFSVTHSGHARVGGFDEGFPGYGFEDIEFAVRFRRAGGVIRYEPRALGLHHHPLTVEAAAARQRHAGRAAVYFWRKHNRRADLGLQLEVHPVLLPLKWLVFRTGPLTRLVRAIRPWAERRQLGPILNECYNHLLWHGYYEGVFAALGEQQESVAGLPRSGT